MYIGRKQITNSVIISIGEMATQKTNCVGGDCQCEAIFGVRVSSRLSLQNWCNAGFPDARDWGCHTWKIEQIMPELSSISEVLTTKSTSSCAAFWHTICAKIITLNSSREPGWWCRVGRTRRGSRTKSHCQSMQLIVNERVFYLFQCGYFICSQISLIFSKAMFCCLKNDAGLSNTKCLFPPIYQRVPNGYKKELDRGQGKITYQWKHYNPVIPIQWVKHIQSEGQSNEYSH